MFMSKGCEQYAICACQAASGSVQVIAARPNVCKQLHMPAQSGSTSTLQRMRRGYTREAYDALVQHVREILPNVALSSDIITGKLMHHLGNHAVRSRCACASGARGACSWHLISSLPVLWACVFSSKHRWTPVVSSGILWCTGRS